MRLCTTLARGLRQPSKQQDAATETSAKFQYHYRVGLVDLDLGLSNLKELADSLNVSQRFFHFTCPELPSVKSAVKSFDGSKNLAVFRIPSSFFAEHPHLAVDLVACFTKYPLAFVEEDRIHHNYFSGPSDTDERFLFVSSDQLYGFAKAAGCSFEQGLVNILVGQLVRYFTKTGYHDEIRGCPMDFCEVRANVVRSLRSAHFCSQCHKRLKPEEFRLACEALLRWNRNDKS